jgi:hypothetical protein
MYAKAGVQKNLAEAFNGTAVADKNSMPHSSRLAAFILMDLGHKKFDEISRLVRKAAPRAHQWAERHRRGVRNDMFSLRNYVLAMHG